MTMPLPCLSSSRGDKHLLGGGRGPMRTSKGMNWAPTSCYYVLLWRNMGWPTAREGQGHGAWVVVVGVTPHQGGRESRAQGRAPW